MECYFYSYCEFIGSTPFKFKCDSMYIVRVSVHGGLIFFSGGGGGGGGGGELSALIGHVDVFSTSDLGACPGKFITVTVCASSQSMSFTYLLSH